MRPIHVSFWLTAVGIFARLASSAQTTPAWDVRGTWDIGFYVQSGVYDLPMSITNEDFETGSFQGLDLQYGYLITGSIVGSEIQFTDTGRPGWSLFFTGEMSTNGTMSGGQDGIPGEMIYYGNSAWHGWFWTDSGRAVSNAAPAFTSQPISQVVGLGQPVDFSVAATNFVSGYQWRFNGVEILGATNSSLHISSTSVTNLGVYTALAFNSWGTNVSAPATLASLNIQAFPGLVLYGPLGSSYDIQERPVLATGADWTTITNAVLTSAQPFIYIDFGAVTNRAMFYRAVPKSG